MLAPSASAQSSVFAAGSTLTRSTAVSAAPLSPCTRATSSTYPSVPAARPRPPSFAYSCSSSRGDPTRRCFSTKLVPTNGLCLPRKVRQEMNLAKLPVSQLKMHLKNLKDRPEMLKLVLKNAAEKKSSETPGDTTDYYSSLGAPHDPTVDGPPRLIPREDEDKLIADIFPGERQSVVEKRKRVHKVVWRSLKQKKWDQFQWCFDQLQMRGLPFDEVTYNFAIYGTLIAHPKRDVEEKIEKAFSLLAQMEAMGIYHPVLVRLHRNFLRGYAELCQIDAMPNRLNVLKVLKAFWETAVSFKRRRMKSLKAELRRRIEAQEREQLLSEIQGILDERLTAVRTAEEEELRIADGRRHVDAPDDAAISGGGVRFAPSSPGLGRGRRLAREERAKAFLKERATMEHGGLEQEEEPALERFGYFAAGKDVNNNKAKQTEQKDRQVDHPSKKSLKSPDPRELLPKYCALQMLGPGNAGVDSKLLDNFPFEDLIDQDCEDDDTLAGKTAPT